MKSWYQKSLRPLFCLKKVFSPLFFVFIMYILYVSHANEYIRVTWSNKDNFLIVKNVFFFWKMKSWIFKFCNKKVVDPNFFSKKSLLPLFFFFEKKSSPHNFFFEKKSVPPIFFQKNYFAPLSIVPAWVPHKFWSVPITLFFTSKQFRSNLGSGSWKLKKLLRLGYHLLLKKCIFLHFSNVISVNVPSSKETCSTSNC